MNQTFEMFLRTQGADYWPENPGPDFPSEDEFAAYLDGVLPLTERRDFERRLLRDPVAFTLLRAAVDALAEARVPVPRTTRILARLAERGLQLINALDLSFHVQREGRLQPALGALRGDAAEESSELLRIDGPGSGLDELELVRQSDGSVHLTVRCREPLPLAEGEISSLVLEADGEPREKRPYSGDALAFSPLGQGRFTLRLLARAPGHEPRELACAHLELSA